MIATIFGAILLLCAVLVGYALLVSIKNPSEDAVPTTNPQGHRRPEAETTAILNEAAMKLLRERTETLERRQALVASSLREQRLIIDFVADSYLTPATNDESIPSI